MDKTFKYNGSSTSLTLVRTLPEVKSSHLLAVRLLQAMPWQFQKHPTLERISSSGQSSRSSHCNSTQKYASTKQSLGLKSNQECLEDSQHTFQKVGNKNPRNVADATGFSLNYQTISQKRDRLKSLNNFKNGIPHNWIATWLSRSDSSQSQLHRIC